jgi:deoxyribodipyrimidine photo-lyase
LNKKNIRFDLIVGDPEIEIVKYIKKNKAGLLVTDFDPLRIKRKWKNSITRSINIALHEVDTHNIVPVWAASDKKEYAAFTIRKKINPKLEEFLVKIPRVKKQSNNLKKSKNNWDKVYRQLKIDKNVEPVEWIKPGEREAIKVLRGFLKDRLDNYHQERNDPTKDNQSNLSPYLHFGQLSTQKVALEIQRSKTSKINKDAFLEELIVRKELADNFCFYEKNYDKFGGFPAWSQKSLKKHTRDKRKNLYSLKKLEEAETHDQVWNAAQIEMVKKGKMHGYMRMYWAKKILEWTQNPQTALRYAIYLNDKYEIDGRDPNGYAGIAWSMGGVHDRPWAERKIFGYVRYMSQNGLKRKFDTNEYIELVKNL